MKSEIHKDMCNNQTRNEADIKKTVIQFITSFLNIKTNFSKKALCKEIITSQF